VQTIVALPRRQHACVVRFDPKSEKFQSWAIPGGGNIVRNTSVTRDGNWLLANSLVNGITLVTLEK
jgi:virginiamycin B lyase